MEDYNKIVKPSEVRREKFKASRVDLMLDMMDKCELLDMEAMGLKLIEGFCFP